MKTTKINTAILGGVWGQTAMTAVLAAYTLVVFFTRLTSGGDTKLLLLVAAHMLAVVVGAVGCAMFAVFLYLEQEGRNRDKQFLVILRLTCSSAMLLSGGYELSMMQQSTGYINCYTTFIVLGGVITVTSCTLPFVLFNEDTGAKVGASIMNVGGLLIYAMVAHYAHSDGSTMLILTYLTVTALVWSGAWATTPYRSA